MAEAYENADVAWIEVVEDRRFIIKE